METKPVEIGEISQCTSIMFQKSKGLTWEEAMPQIRAELLSKLKESGVDIDSAFHFCTITMPCGNVVSYKTFEDIPRQDTPCPCGDPKHWLVRYVEF